MAEPATRSARSLAATRETVIRPPVFSPGSLGPAFRGLIEHRDLLYTLSLHRIRVRYKQSLLGIGWAVVQPLATMVVLTVVFAYITRVPTGAVPYAVFALAGLVPWTCFANGLTTATHSLVSHAQLVTKVYFPREILPLTYVIAAVTDAAIAAAALVGLMAWYTVPVAPRIGLVLITAATLITLVTALALVLSAMQVRMRDVGVAMPIALQLLMFASPVAYPLDTVPARLHALYILNPLVGIVENFRRAALDTGQADVESLQVSIVWAVVLLPIAYVWFKRVDATAADVV
jgi:lipopolysaccharide transport system permease protein